MKSCPTCNRTYPDDTLAFCLMDGSVLSAPYDPKAKEAVPSTRESSPPRTEVMNVAAEPEPLPPTRAATPPLNLQPTMTAPPSARPQLPASEPATRRPLAAKQSAIGAKVWIGLVVLVFVGAIGIVFLAALSRSGNTNSGRVNVNITSNTAPATIVTTPTPSMRLSQLTIRISHNGCVPKGFIKVRLIDVQVSADGRNQEEHEIKPGQSYEVTVKDNVRLRYDNGSYDCMELTINGRRAKLPPPPIGELYDEVLITTDNYGTFLE